MILWSYDTKLKYLQFKFFAEVYAKYFRIEQAKFNVFGIAFRQFLFEAIHGVELFDYKVFLFARNCQVYILFISEV